MSDSTLFQFWRRTWCERCFSSIGHTPSCDIKEWVVIHTINGWRTEYKTVNEFQRSEWDWRLHVWFMHDEPFVLKTINFPMYPLMTSLIVGVYEHLMIPVPTEMFNQFSLNAVVRPGVQVIFAFDLSPDSVKAKFRREA